jgi:hypothetical protein
MPPQQEVLGTFDVAGIACRVECRDHAFWELLSPSYREFASDAVPQLFLRVEITEEPPEDVAARWSGPFARIGGQDGVLSIEGLAFRGAFDEQSGEGWIAQPLDPAPFETFLTAIYAGRLLKEDGFLLHAAALTVGDWAYAFYGPSGSGKTTVAGLAGTGVITDEIAAIRRQGEGYQISGVPWRGQRLSAPLAGLFRLRKAQATAFTPLSPVETVRQLLPNVFFSRADSSELGRFFAIGGSLVTKVPCYEMHFTPDGSFLARIIHGGTREFPGPNDQ